MIINELLALRRASDPGCDGNGARTPIFPAGLKVCQVCVNRGKKGLFDGNAGKPRHPLREGEDEA